MLKISPVPWTIYEKTHVMSGERLVANTGGYSSNVDSDKVIEENMANAQMITAAPELYEALKELCWECRNSATAPRWGYVANALTAIAKADGDKDGG